MQTPLIAPLVFSQLRLPAKKRLSFALVAAAVMSIAVAGWSPAEAQRFCPDPFNAAPCTAVTNSATGSTGAIAATLPAAAGKTTYICGFHFQGSNATGAVAGNVAVTNTISGTMNFGYVALAAAATVQHPPPTRVELNPCVPANAINTTIVVTPPTLGAGATLATVTAWGYQL